MATYYLGPECPSPFSALSESHAVELLNNLRKVKCDYSSNNTFDLQYSRHLHDLVQRYLDVDRADRICYVGEDMEFLKLLEDLNYLKHKVEICKPGAVYCNPQKGELPVIETEHGIDDYFVGKVDCFDKIIIQDSLIFMKKQLSTLANISRSLACKGKLLIVHRSQDTNTLPVFSQAKQNMIEYDKSHVEVIQHLKKCAMKVSWNMECIPCKMTKMEWLSKISHKQPAHLNLCNMYEVTEGLRDLTEGVLKYQDGLMEFQDQLVFIEASRATEVAPLPTDTEKKKDNKDQRLNLHYELLVTPEIYQYIRFLNIPKLPKVEKK